MAIVVRSVTPNDLDGWLQLRQALWGGEFAEHRREVATYFHDGAIVGIPHGIFVAQQADGALLVGFAEVSLVAVSIGGKGLPAAHLEGWYVSPAVRRNGVGRALMDATIAWARACGCTRMTSDTSSTYADLSTPAHLACGFQIDPAVAARLGPPEDGTTAIGFMRSI